MAETSLHGGSQSFLPSHPRSGASVPFARPNISDADIEAVTAVLRSGWLTTGPTVASFESAFGEYVGAPAAIGLNSCTAALHVALATFDIGPGDAVLASTLTFSSSIHVIEQVGATPVLVDVTPDTLTPDPQSVRRTVQDIISGRIRGRGGEPVIPKALLPVHFAGHAAPMEDLDQIARDHDLAVIEDAAHALPTLYGSELIGGRFPADIKRAVCFSFYATKNITTGEGGMLVLPPAYTEAAREWSLHGMTRDAWGRYDVGGKWRYDVVRAGFKYNMTDLEAALGLSQLSRATAFHRRRAEIASRYHEAFGPLDYFQLPTELPGTTHSWHLYSLRLAQSKLHIGRDQFFEELQAHGIAASVHFIPVHMLTYYQQRYGYRTSDFPVAYDAFERLISLPIYPAMSDEDVEKVIHAVLTVATQHRS